MTELARRLEQIEGLIARQAMLKGWSAHTRAAYLRDLTDAERWLAKHAGRSLWDAGAEEIGAYLGALARAKKKPSTIRRRRAALSVWYRLLRELGIREDDPLLVLARPRAARELPRVLSEEDVRRLLDACPDTDARGLRNRTILEMLYATGLRVSELVALAPSDLDLERRFVRVRGKGDKERWVPFAERTGEWLLRWLAVRPRGSPFLFPGRGRRAITRQQVFNIVRAAAQAAGLSEPLPSPHSLRHAFATHLLAHGADLRAVQMLLGHAQVTTTEIYTHLAQESLAEVVRSHHPLAHPPR